MRSSTIGCAGPGGPCEWVHTGVREVKGGEARRPPSNFDNDPSAGSPTETLLRLLLPLNDQV